LGQDPAVSDIAAPRSGNRMLAFEPDVKATIKIGIDRWSCNAWQGGEQEYHGMPSPTLPAALPA
jgi:hypothetical protein